LFAFADLPDTFTGIATPNQTWIKLEAPAGPYVPADQEGSITVYYTLDGLPPVDDDGFDEAIGVSANCPDSWALWLDSGINCLDNCLHGGNFGEVLFGFVDDFEDSYEIDVYFDFVEDPPAGNFTLNRVGLCLWQGELTIDGITTTVQLRYFVNPNGGSIWTVGDGGKTEGDGSSPVGTYQEANIIYVVKE
jgi:hypothetical protein